MSANAIVVQGTLTPEGTLQLDEKPSLPSGRVQVTIQPMAQPAELKEDWWEYLQRLRAELVASGHQFRTQEEIDAEMEEIRDWDGRIEEVYRQLDEQRKED